MTIQFTKDELQLLYKGLTVLVQMDRDSPQGCILDARGRAFHDEIYNYLKWFVEAKSIPDNLSQ